MPKVWEEMLRGKGAPFFSLHKGDNVNVPDCPCIQGNTENVGLDAPECPSTDISLNAFDVGAPECP